MSDPQGRKWYTEQSIQNIADAIRELDGDETKMLVTDMPARILKLSSGVNLGPVQNALNNEINRSVNKDAELEQLITDLAGSLETRINEYSDLSDRVEDVVSKSDTNHNSIVALNNRVTDFNTRLSELAARITELETKTPTVNPDVPTVPVLADYVSREELTGYGYATLSDVTTEVNNSYSHFDSRISDISIRVDGMEDRFQEKGDYITRSEVEGVRDEFNRSVVAATESLVSYDMLDNAMSQKVDINVHQADISAVRGEIPVGVAYPSDIDNRLTEYVRLSDVSTEVNNALASVQDGIQQQITELRNQIDEIKMAFEGEY